MELLHLLFRFLGAVLLWDEPNLNSIRSSTSGGASAKLFPPITHQAYAGKLPAPAGMITMMMGVVPLEAPNSPSSFFGDWPPRWYLDAINQGEGMIRDGGRAPQLVLALIAAITGRRTPTYTAYATPILHDIAGQFNVVVPDSLPTANETAGGGSTSLTLQGAMTRARVDDWVQYVEYNILMEFLAERFPRYVHMWNAQTAGGVDPRAPIQPWTEDRAGLDVFNNLLAQGMVGPQVTPAPYASQPSWAAQVVRDVRQFHHDGYRVGGLVQAIGCYVDGRGYGAHTAWAHRQLHTVYSMTCELHNLTTSVPPAHFNSWASNREVQLWALSQSKATRFASTGMPLMIQAVVCSTFRNPLWCAISGLVMAKAQPGGGPVQGEEPQGMTLPQWLVAVARTMSLLQNAGMSGPDILGLLSSVAQERGDPRYQTFSNTVIEIIRAIAAVPHVGTHPGVPEREAVELIEFADRHMLAEYLATYHEAEVVLHEALVERNEGLRLRTHFRL